jgi:hypothetical protein
MTARQVFALLEEILASAPAALLTGAEIIRLVNEGYELIRSESEKPDPSPEAIRALVARIAANSARIGSTD